MKDMLEYLRMIRVVSPSGVAEGGTESVGKGGARDPAVEVGVSTPTGEHAASHNARRGMVRRTYFMILSSREYRGDAGTGRPVPAPSVIRPAGRRFACSTGLFGYP
jgi:hypothetical protein